jgi:chromosome segregation ATPase
MYQSKVLFLAPFLLSAVAFAQPASPDTQLTQALLTEIRQLRLDLQTAAGTIQRVQIVMFRVQTQSGILNRATQRLDDARNRCNQSQMQRRSMAAQVELNETRLRNAPNPAEQKAAEDTISRLKPTVEMFAASEQQCRGQEAEAESQLRSEQGKMNDLQEQLDKLDKLLASPGGK